MFSWPRDRVWRVSVGAAVASTLLAAIGAVQAQQPVAPTHRAVVATKNVANPAITGTVRRADVSLFKGIGRSATPAEIAAWDIDVRADLVGLPKGSGSVAKGMEVWEAKCASCHGVFGESNEVFQPIVGGTTKADVQSGRVANLQRADYPGRTTMMKLSSVSSLWDYIYRAMPWNAPKSLTVEEVYAVTGYILHLADVLPADFVLKDSNMAQVQQMLPNRNGKTTDHGKWPGTEFLTRARAVPFDAQGSTCMANCKPSAPQIDSHLPPHARNAHGNLAEQQRLVGAMRGVDTTQPSASTFGAAVVVASAPAARAAARPAAPAPVGVAPDAAQMQRLLAQHHCTACHAHERRLVGPSFAEIAGKHASQVDYLADKVKNGGVGVWGSIPMPAQGLPMADARQIAQWLASGATKP
jgi:S-disulfanyl-L-cysteine oxidoreductase SoxD